jgi:hypothetical protein
MANAVLLDLVPGANDVVTFDGDFAETAGVTDLKRMTGA